MDFCIETGKSITTKENASTVNSNESNAFKSIYYKNPCVPIDFPTIQDALHVCAKRDSTIYLMPDTYQEQLKFDTTESITICAAKPLLGATLTMSDFTSEFLKDQPCVRITGSTTKGIHVKMSNLEISHFSRGADIWGGNAAVLVEGQLASLHLDGCTIQSDTGRGIVVTDGASVDFGKILLPNLNNSSMDSSVISFEDHEEIDCMDIDYESDSMLPYHSNDTDGETDQEAESVDEEEEYVHAGHSGIYIETGHATIEDCLVGGNNLTGISVVRRGTVLLVESDVTENGTEPVANEDLNDFPYLVNEVDLPFSTRSLQGGILDGSIGNNFVSRSANDSGTWTSMGGNVRCFTFPFLIKENFLEDKSVQLDIFRRRVNRVAELF
eukprot:scaffold17774_cov44-Attheya_sp.AAC.4